MGKYILKRVLMAIVTLLVIVCTMFLLLRFMPGSPFNDEMLTKEQIAIMMEALRPGSAVLHPVFELYREYAPWRSGRFLQHPGRHANH